MYEHCKLAEDPDLNLIDFVFDHLMGIDGSFDKHENGDDEKPHSTTPFQQQQHQPIFNNVCTAFNYSVSMIQNFISAEIITDFYSGNFTRGIFHPPSL